MPVRMKHRLPCRPACIQPHVPAADRGVLDAELLPPPLQKFHHRVPLWLVQSHAVRHVPPGDHQAVPRAHRVGVGDSDR
jgi:hypothetical protein